MPEDMEPVSFYQNGVIVNVEPTLEDVGEIVALINYTLINFLELSGSLLYTICESMKKKR